MSFYLAIDLGTTGCRSMLFDSRLNELAYSYEEYGLINIREGWTEQDAQLWWDITLRTARDAISRANISALDIKSIAVSSQGITLVPVDKDVKPLRNAISWLDVRAKAETERIERDFGGRMFEITGKRTLPDYTLPKLLWLMENERDIYERAYKLLMPCDFLVARMTGKFLTDSSMASGTLMFDLKNNCWSDEILDKYGIDKSKLPAVERAYSPAGRVCDTFRDALGLSPECVVAVGAQDQKCAAYGAGLTDGTMTVSLGTAAAISKLWRSAEISDRGVGWCGYVEEGSFVTEGVIGTAGTCLRWIRDMLFKGEDYDVINNEAERAMKKGSSLTFFPFFGGASSPFYYKESTGSFYGLTLSTERGDMAAAVMEGIAFNLRSILVAMEAYGNVDRIVLFGGGSKGPLWCQTIANACGIPVVTLTSSEAAGAGAARLAARAVGDALMPLCENKTYMPTNTDYYNERYERYLALEKRFFEVE